ncbi:MAG: hypothetical protein ACXWIU_02315 [Limisphaerales bacterium]
MTDETKQPQPEKAKTEYVYVQYLQDSEKVFRKLDLVLVVLLAAIGTAIYLVWKARHAAAQ